MRMKSLPPKLEPRLRISGAGQHLFGPGKAELLHFIAATGSIRAAAREMDMSYQRTWSLVQEMNTLFKKPLVAVTRGGGVPAGCRVTRVPARAATTGPAGRSGRGSARWAGGVPWAVPARRTLGPAASRGRSPARGAPARGWKA